MNDPATLTAALGRYRIVAVNEDELQTGIAAAFDAAAIPYQREARLGPRDRIDFLAGSIGVEVKIKGTVAALIRQLQRYAAHDSIDALVVVTTRMEHRRLPDQVGGVPVVVHVVLPW